METRRVNLIRKWGIKMVKQLQQGDVNIITERFKWVNNSPAIGTERMKKRDGGIVREGETTGHAHRILGTDFQLYQLGARLFGRILSGDCRIVHEEHGTIELPVGDYEFTPTVEYDHFTERSRRVVD